MIRLRYLTLSVLAVLIVVSIVPFVSSDVIRGESTVPNWVKNTAGWWASDQIPDSAFLQGIQYLIKEGIMIVEIPTEIDSEAAEEVPGWIKNTAGWWAEDKIHDTTFVSGIKYLIGTGILVVMEPQVEEAKCNFKGKEVVCSLTEKEVVEINDFYIEVNSGSCSYCLNWTYVGEEYKLCKNYHLGSISYTTSFSVADKEIQPHGIAFNDDGTKMFIVGQAGGGLDEYALATAWDISSAVWTTNGCTNGNENQKYSAVDFNADGTGARILDKNSNKVREFVLSTAYDISTCGNHDSDNDSTDLNGLSGVSEAKAQGMAFNDDGTKMYIVGEQHDKVYEIDLDSAYDVSSNTGTPAAFEIRDQEKVPTGLEFSSDGKTMFVVGKNGDEINIYSLATAWNISTAEHK